MWVMKSMQSGNSLDIMMKTMTIRENIIFLDPSFAAKHLEFYLFKSQQKKSVYSELSLKLFFKKEKKCGIICVGV